MSDPSMHRAGSRIGPYRVLRTLGVGGMGEVHLGVDDRLGRHVAIKVLPAGLARDPGRLERFRSEAVALAAINHPNIAAIYGIEALEDGSPCLVLERIDGETLGNRIARGALPLAEALRVMAQAAEGLEAAHACGVVHRDLHPDNLMLDRRGRVKVLDFGIARMKTRPAALLPPGDASQAGSPPSGAREAVAARVTEEGISTGTPGYMSPEQVAGEPIDERTDLFALGCVLFECLTARRAFDGDTTLARLTAVMWSAPDFGALPAGTPGAVRDLLERCLAKESARRPVSAAAVRTELEEALGIRQASAIREGRSEAFRHNLPAERTRFVGRAESLERCARWLEFGRLLTLTGSGGSGKTRLALRLAAEHVSAFPGGVWFVDLTATRDPLRVGSAVATVLGVRESAGAIEDALAADLGARPRTLLVLDNCEHLTEACATLVHRLLEGTRELHLLATSRERLAVAGEQVHAVPALDLAPAPGGDAARMSEAVELFVDRARAVAPGFERTAANAAAIAEICRRTEGIPLAIELAAARTRMLGVEEILARIDDRFRLLTGGPAGVPRHATLLATLEWSHDLLDEDERRALRVLSVFAGGWTLHAAAAVWDEAADAFGVLDVIARLVDKSLVVVDGAGGLETRYRMLETIAAFARLKAQSSGDTTPARDRHLRYFADATERWSQLTRDGKQVEGLGRITADHENALAALEWSAEAQGLAYDGLRIVGALWYFWAHRGLVRLGRRMLFDALARDAEATPTIPRARALNGAAYVSYLLGDHAAAQRAYAEELEVATAVDHAGLMSASHLGLGLIGMGTHDRATAIAHFDRARELSRASGDLRNEALALQNLAVMAFEVQDWRRGLVYNEESIALARTLGDLTSVANGLNNHATIGMRAGDFATARTALLEALAMIRDLAVGPIGLIALETAAELAVMTGRAEVGARLMGAVQALRESLGLVQPIAEERAIAEDLTARLLATLGEAAWRRLVEEGGRLSLANAVDVAIAWLEKDALGVEA